MALKFLLLSSDPSLEETLRQVPLGIPFRFDHIDSGPAGMRAMDAQVYDAVFIDCDDLSGAENVLRDLRSVHANRDTPVLAILNGTTEAEEALDFGATATVQKPIDPQPLARVLKSALENRR